MRTAREGDKIRKLLSSPPTSGAPVFRHESAELIQDRQGMVIGGLNGAGKTRLLRSIATESASSVHIEIHKLCVQALEVLRERADHDAMAEEFESLELSEERLDDLARIVGRRYDSVEWFALEIEPADPLVAEEFRWGDPHSEPLVPHFRVSYRGQTYGSTEMGLGEFSMHLLLWILEMQRAEDYENKAFTVILDEPDAFLPPVGVRGLLGRLSRICIERRWNLIVATHSEELIRTAVEHGSFTYVYQDAKSQPVLIRVADDPDTAEHLLSRSPVNAVLFCEDEAALYLSRAILETSHLAATTRVLWCTGDGDLNVLRSRIPGHRDQMIRFGFAYDGDQRDDTSTEQAWPPIFLPTHASPEHLLHTAGQDPERLAVSLGADRDQLARRLDAIQGDDAHDWISRLGETYGRQLVHEALARLWVEDHAHECSEFVAAFKSHVLGKR